MNICLIALLLINCLMLSEILARSPIKLSILALDSENGGSEEKSGSKQENNDFSDVYFKLSEINNFLKKSTIENELAQLEYIGKTFNRRSTYMIKISSTHDNKKPIVLIEAGMHAREWASPALAVFLIQQLLKNNTSMLDDFDWFIIPVINSDGYEFSYNSNRYWRKTRSKNGKCLGVDANRNFDFHWAESGVNKDPCSDTYPGPSAFSEIEAKNLRNVGEKYKSRIHTYLSLHAYGGYILYPWGYAKKKASHWQILQKCGMAGAEAIKQVTGIQYQVGNTATLLYTAAGGSDDYFMGMLNVPFSYTIELWDGGNQFYLAASELSNMTRGAFEGIKALVNCTKVYWYSRKLNN